MPDHHAATPARPPLLRGNTLPLYVRSPSSSSNQDPLRQPADQDRHLSHSDRYSPPGPRTGETAAPPHTHNYMANGQPGAAHAHTPRPPQNLWALTAALPTPPLSTSPGSAESYHHPSDAYFPPHPSARGHAKGDTALRVQPPPPAPFASASASASAPPSVTSPSAAESPSLQLLRARTRGPPARTAPMRIESSGEKYVLSARIGPGFDSSCITIAALKGNVLNIVADRWDMEKDCHHEWHVQFDRDADMRAVHAGYSNGVLTVTVKRLLMASARPPQLRS